MAAGTSLCIIKVLCIGPAPVDDGPGGGGSGGDSPAPGRPEKRYLYTDRGAGLEPVSAFMPHKAAQLANLLAHPEIKVTILDAESAIGIYNDLEARFPSRETIRNGRPRSYLPPVLD